MRWLLFRPHRQWRISGVLGACSECKIVRLQCVAFLVSKTVDKETKSLWPLIKSHCPELFNCAHLYCSFFYWHTSLIVCSRENFQGIEKRSPTHFCYSSGMYNLLLLPPALLSFIWSTAANEFELYLWDTAKFQPTQNTFKHKLCIHSITLYDITIHIFTHRVDWFSCLAFVLLQYTPAPPPNLIIYNYMWTAANFIIEGRMRPYSRRLCTVAIVL